MLSNREGQSSFLDGLVEVLATEENTGIAKTASDATAVAPVTVPAAVESPVVEKAANSSHPIEKAAAEKAAAEKVAAEKLTLHQVRVARREGRFVKVAGHNDLYQDATTNDFWKISEDKQYAVRSFDDNNGLAVSK
jgi:hypothetical protein